MYDIRFPNLGLVLRNIKDGFSIFGFEIKFYGIIIAFGFLFAYIIISKEAKRTGQDEEKYLDLILWMIIPAILGARIAEQIQLFHLPITLGKVTIDQYLNEKDTITFGGLQLTAISTPGHSPGSLSYYNSDKKIVFTGDALFKQSIGRTDLPGGDYATLINSITEKILTLPDSTIICPGHGPTTTVKDEKKFNPYV